MTPARTLEYAYLIKNCLSLFFFIRKMKGSSLLVFHSTSYYLFLFPSYDYCLVLFMSTIYVTSTSVIVFLTFICKILPP